MTPCRYVGDQTRQTQAPDAYLSLLSLICTFYRIQFFSFFVSSPSLWTSSRSQVIPGSLVMAVPCNIRGSASQLFYQDHQSPQYQALLAITELPHPDRSILGAFLVDARDPQEAARYFLRETVVDGTSQSVPTRTIWEFLSDWKYLISMCEHNITRSK